MILNFFSYCKIGTKREWFSVKWSNNKISLVIRRRIRSRDDFHSFNFNFIRFFSADSDSLSLPLPPIEEFRHKLPAPTRSEILCSSHEIDKFLPDDGIESSVTIDLRPGRTMNSCKRYFIAPESSGLFIRLVKSDENQNDTHRRNLTEFCPLSIVSSLN